MKKKVIWTDHAKERCKQRDITLEDVERIIEIADRQGRISYNPKAPEERHILEAGRVRVVLATLTPMSNVVITVIWDDRRPRRKLDRGGLKRKRKSRLQKLIRMGRRK